MNRPVCPCVPECPDRRSGCRSEACPHGWADYERQRMAWYREKDARRRKREIGRMPTAAHQAKLRAIQQNRKEGRI